MKLFPALLVLALLQCACSASKNFTEAKAATEEFHRLVDIGEYGIIYDHLDQSFKDKVTRDQSLGFFKRVARKMGRCAESPLVFGGYNVMNSRTCVTLNSDRKCVNGKLAEQFVWSIVDGKLLLIRYNVENPLLLTD